ncbi:MAG: U32 family peptidase [Rhodospirillales bacterium]|jgi:O2-independent ubiquinone biosynthesis protein UbiV|nr:U32 family peptidase [Rhodospirillales bacterium]MBT7944030.1 U32 family peptidase [Alphaproteobacteria bacterium]
MTAKLSLGPVLFHWEAEKKRDFYFRIADEASVDTVYLGEVVCSKRTSFFAPYVPEVVERLQRGGKQVILSTLALIMSEAEIAQVIDLSENTDMLIEANDIGTAALLAGRPHVIGPFINVYNEGTLEYLANQGATRISLPWELPSQSLSAVAKSTTTELEAQVFGRVPLAISARCYHARAHGLHKSKCQFVCAEDLNGMTVETLDGEDFLAVNGCQTLSHKIGNLIGELDDLHHLGINAFRIWPHAINMVAVAQTFREVLDGWITVLEGQEKLAENAGFAPFSNGFFHDKEGAAYIS